MALSSDIPSTNDPKDLSMPVELKLWVFFKRKKVLPTHVLELSACLQGEITNTVMFISSIPIFRNT